MTNVDERAMEHAWRYFALHAEQRTTVFNFFTAAAGLTLSGLAYVSATDSAPGEFGLAAGVGAMLLALVFWKLDQRVAQLTKCAEEILIANEKLAFPEVQQVFARSEKLPINRSKSPFSGTWTYGRSFRILFASVAALGLIGAGINGYRLVRATKDKAPSPASVASLPAKVPSAPLGGAKKPDPVGPTATIVTEASGKTPAQDERPGKSD